jgi:hypothetical protein
MGNYVPGTYLVFDPLVVSGANLSMGLETTSPATPKIFPTTLGNFAGVADAVPCGPNGQLVFYRVDKLDGLVAGHRPVAPGTRHTNSPGPARGHPEHVGGGDGLGVLHTSYSLYYASRYHQSEGFAGGLAFPGEQNLRLLDFAYFAFTIDTRFAVSDVEVKNSKMRRSVLGHQILAFFYNAAILSLTINLAVDL